MLMASLRSISVFTCRVYGLYQILFSWETFIHRHPFEVFVILYDPRWSPYEVARKLAQIIRLSREILKIGRVFNKSCTCTVQYLIVKLLLLLALRLGFLCRVVELPDVRFSISAWMKMNFLVTWRIFCRNRSPGAWCPSRPELNAPGVVLVTLSESCWHRFSRLESPPAWYSGGGTAWQSMSAFLRYFFSLSLPSNELAFASTWLMQRKILRHVHPCWKIKDSRLQKKLTT